MKILINSLIVVAFCLVAVSIMVPLALGYVLLMLALIMISGASSMAVFRLTRRSRS